MNNIEIIRKYTYDNLRLPMVHFQIQEKDICVIFIHGMCGNFIDNYFAYVWGRILSQNNIGFIYEHNRGHSIANDISMKDGSSKRYGCMYEIFEESIYDIDTSIETAKELGYKKIILLGHSYGCNKVIYYYYKKQPDILGVILASAPDMVGIHKILEKDYNELIIEAKKNIMEEKPDKLLHKRVEDYMYMSSKTYYNWYNASSNMDNLPIISNPDSWPQFESIEVPLLTFSGSNEEEYYLKLDLLKSKAKKCPDFEYKIIENTDHIYTLKEQESGEVIYNWIKNKFLR